MHEAIAHITIYCVSLAKTRLPPPPDPDVYTLMLYAKWLKLGGNTQTAGLVKAGYRPEYLTYI